MPREPVSEGRRASEYSERWGAGGFLRGEHPVPLRFRDNLPDGREDDACIGFRFSNGLYRWAFEKGRTTLSVSPQGPASFDDPDLVIKAVLDGVGLGTSMEESIKELLHTGRPR